MKLNFKHILVAAILSLPIFVAAQNTRSGYFLDDYTYRFQMNPAYGNSKGFVSMPALGNFNFGVSGTLGLGDILYNVNGQTTTFLNPQISAEEALSRIGDKNRLDMDMKMTILGFGFKAFGGYNTFSLNARAGFGFKIPGSAFSLLKEGVANKNYEIANIKGYGTGFAEVSLGHSHDITPEIRVGANLKILVGVGNANINFKKADLTLGENDWSITTDAEVNVNFKGFKYDTDINENNGHEYVSGADVDFDGIGGFGLAFDLGAVYKPIFLPDWEFSFALQDLGFISWSNNMLATTGGERTFNTDKYVFNVDDEAPNSFDNEWDKIKDDISALYELDDMGDQGGQTRGIGATMNIGALYTFPMYRNLKFGLLNTTRINGAFSWTDFRLSANVMPCKVFDAGINLSAGTFGVGFGWIANLHCPGFNLFIGMDKTLGKLAKQGVPLNSNAQFNLGIDFLF